MTRLVDQPPSRFAIHEAGHAVMAVLCELRILRVVLAPPGTGCVSLAESAPVSAYDPDCLRSLHKHVLTLLAGKGAEERADADSTSVCLHPIHIYDYEGTNGVRALIGRWIGLTGENYSVELDRWERCVEEIFANDSVWEAVLQIARLADEASIVDGEKFLDGDLPRDIVHRLVHHGARARLTECC
jgi:hypothetical protein